MLFACVDKLSLICISSASFIMALPDGSRVRGDREILQCTIRIGDRDWFTDLIVMQLAHEDEVILGMDWLRRYLDVLDVHQRTVTLTVDDGTTHV
jgi:hypothetical protein